MWNETNKQAWLACVSDLLRDDEVLSMDALPQHRAGFSCLRHCVMVSYFSYCICEFFGWRSREAARGGLLHDLYLYNWKDRSLHGAWEHLQNHPKWALENAKKRFLLTPRERDAIATHMFPLTPTPYHYLESFAVSTADKLCAAAELLGVQFHGFFVPMPELVPADGGWPVPKAG